MVLRQLLGRISTFRRSSLTPPTVEVSPTSRNRGGFTLLELLLVVAVMAVLAVVLILVLNPSETLKKSRDSQRISDLTTLKTVLAIYATTVTDPSLGPTANCLGYDSTLPGDVTSAVIYYSLPHTGTEPDCTANVPEGDDVEGGSSFGGTGAAGDSCTAVALANNAKVDGSGWIPVDLTTITGGSPLSSLPVDPTNTVANVTAPANTDYVYRYACQKVTDTPPLEPQNVFELNARLESAEFGPNGADDKAAKDGGDQGTLYEVGTSVRLMGNDTNY
ncbi:MAG: prepilin-type N-terminal cleavage/methylation domain-containing protein [Candidatus Kerfeldbacteria bacterium]|nr:prepilin-type N-terminal cleavage/methylation domain-containing protein [Candidatus Kerfeldbacteria bacterium]